MDAHPVARLQSDADALEGAGIIVSRVDETNILTTRR